MLQQKTGGKKTSPGHGILGTSAEVAAALLFMVRQQGYVVSCSGDKESQVLTRSHVHLRSGAADYFF